LLAEAVCGRSQFRRRRRRTSGGTGAGVTRLVFLYYPRRRAGPVNRDVRQTAVSKPENMIGPH
jgi:hypothetical protein